MRGYAKKCKIAISMGINYMPDVIAAIIYDYSILLEEDVLISILMRYTDIDGMGKLIIPNIGIITWWPAFDDYRLKSYYININDNLFTYWEKSLCFSDLLPSRGSAYRVIQQRMYKSITNREIKEYIRYMAKLFKHEKMLISLAE